MDLIDRHEVPIPCPKCGNKTKNTIRWIKANSNFTCACGTIVNLKADQFRREMAKTDRILADFQRSLDKLKK